MYLNKFTESKKEDLTKHIDLLNQNNFYSEIKEKYIEYINSLNQKQKSSNKNFYIIISQSAEDITNLESVTIQNLQENYFKVKELLARCGNIVSEYTKENQIREVLFSFLNSRIFLNG